MYRKSKNESSIVAAMRKRKISETDKRAFYWGTLALYRIGF